VDGGRAGLDLSSAKLLSWAEAEPRPAVAADLLDSIAPSELDADGQVSLAQAWARVEAGAAAGKLAALAAFAGPGESSGSEDFAELEIGAALRLGIGSAGRLVTVARQLAGKLLKTMAALADGRIDYLRALRIAEATFGLDAAACALVEDRILGRAAHQSAGQVGAAARRAAAAADPDALARRHRQAKADADVRLAHDEDGMGWITANMPSLDAQLVYAAVGTWARRRKAAGDTRTLGQLRGAALREWSEAYLSGRPTAPDGQGWPDAADADPGAHAGTDADHGTDRPDADPVAGAAPNADPVVDAGSGSGARRGHGTRVGQPSQHGRPVTVNVTVDLPTFLGLTDHPGEVQPGGLIPAEAIRDLIPDVKLRRLIVDPMTGALLDHGRRTYRVPADLAAFVTARDATAATPGATGPSTSGDLDHLVPYEDGGQTSPGNLHAISRRWHRAKTIGGWRVARNDDGSVTWTSPLGRTYRCHPHDYRLGP
jgi:hypothetical protein